jgi:general secretion pathway protein G
VWWLGSLGSARDGLTSSRANAAEIQTAAKAFRAQHTDGCPTLSSLQEEQLLTRNVRGDDAWGNRFRISCQDGEIEVTSAGPDGKPNNADDIRASR